VAVEEGIQVSCSRNKTDLTLENILTVRNQIVDKWNSLSQDCIYCTTINALKEHFQKHPQEPETHYTNSVSLDRGLHRQQPVFTVAISGIALVASVNSVKVWNTVIPQPTKHGVTYLSKAALAEHFEYGEVSESHPFLERIRLALVWTVGEFGRSCHSGRITQSIVILCRKTTKLKCIIHFVNVKQRNGPEGKMRRNCIRWIRWFTLKIWYGIVGIN